MQATAPALDAKFARLARAWREDCAFVSSATEMAMHPGEKDVLQRGQSRIAEEEPAFHLTDWNRYVPAPTA